MKTFFYKNVLYFYGVFCGLVLFNAFFLGVMFLAEENLGMLAKVNLVAVWAAGFAGVGIYLVGLASRVDSWGRRMLSKRRDAKRADQRVRELFEKAGWDE